MPFDIRIQQMGQKYREASYEPELRTGLEWILTEPKANLRIHTTGTIVVTGGKNINKLFVYKINYWSGQSKCLWNYNSQKISLKQIFA